MSMAKQKPVIIYENTVSGTFVRRLNRFTAEVLIDGQMEIVHVKNTGRLQELLVPKAKAAYGNCYFMGACIVFEEKVTSNN